MSAKDDLYPDVKVYGPDVDVSTIWRAHSTEDYGVEVFSHPGAVKNAGVVVIGPKEQVLAYIDLKPVACKDWAPFPRS